MNYIYKVKSIIIFGSIQRLALPGLRQALPKSSPSILNIYILDTYLIL